MNATATVRDFADMPDDARLWIFAAERPLDAAEARALTAVVDDFLAGWHAHRHPVVGARDLRLDRFLLVAADERATGVSGCSIDSLYRALKDAERRLGVSLLDSSLVLYRDRDGTVHSVDRAGFRALVRSGAVNAGTRVFDNTVGSVGELRSEQWERSFSSSWHARAFSAPDPRR